MDNQSSFSRTRKRLEEIVTQIKAKDVPLEKSLDLYEEALRLGGMCAELIDRTDFSSDELEGIDENEEGSPEPDDSDSGDTDEDSADGDRILEPDSTDGDSPWGGSTDKGSTAVLDEVKAFATDETETDATDGDRLGEDGIGEDEDTSIEKD